MEVASERARISRLAGVLRSGPGSADFDRAVDEVNALFSANHDRVYALCLKLVGHPQRARELTQDAMLAAYEQLPKFRGEAKFSTWLLRIARYKCFHALRERRDLLSEDGVLEGVDPARTVLAALRRQEKEELLRQAATAVLDPLEQEAVYLRYVEQLPRERIEALLHLDNKTGARGLLQRCRRKLGRELRRRLEELGHGSSFVRGTW